MDCILLVAKSWSQPTLACYWLDIHENTFRNVVCEIETILYWSQYIRIQPHIFPGDYWRVCCSLVCASEWHVSTIPYHDWFQLYIVIDILLIISRYYSMKWNHLHLKKKVVKLCSICSCNDNLQLLYIVAGRCICEIGHYHDCWCCGYQ